MQGLRTDLYIDYKYSNLNPNQKQHSFKLHHGFEISKLSCSTELIKANTSQKIELKQYVFLEENGHKPVVISNLLSEKEEQ